MYASFCRSQQTGVSRSEGSHFNKRRKSAAFSCMKGGELMQSQEELLEVGLQGRLLTASQREGHGKSSRKL